MDIHGAGDKFVDRSQRTDGLQDTTHNACLSLGNIARTLKFVIENVSTEFENA